MPLHAVIVNAFCSLLLLIIINYSGPQMLNLMLASCETMLTLMLTSNMLNLVLTLMLTLTLILMLASNDTMLTSVLVPQRVTAAAAAALSAPGVGESGRGVRGASPGAGELRFTGGGRTESSGSDSDDDDDDDDDDDLMVSQEMRPGFSGQAVSLTPLDAIDEAGVGLGVALGAALGVDCPLTTTPDNT